MTDMVETIPAEAAAGEAAPVASALSADSSSAAAARTTPASEARARKTSARRRLVFDGAVLVVYAVAANPAVTGIPIHEWAGLGAFVLLAAHCAARGMGRGVTAKGIALTVLNTLVLLCLALCVVSGVMVSGTVLPALGLFAEGYYFWDPLHAVAAKLLLALLLVHVAVHVPWIGRVLKK